MALGVIGRALVVVTGIWLLAGTVLIKREGDSSRIAAGRIKYENCEQLSAITVRGHLIADPDDGQRGLCLLETDAQVEYDNALWNVWGSALAISAMIAAVVWVLGFIAVFVGRWVIDGRENDKVA